MCRAYYMPGISFSNTQSRILMILTTNQFPGVLIEGMSKMAMWHTTMFPINRSSTRLREATALWLQIRRRPHCNSNHSPLPSLRMSLQPVAAVIKHRVIRDHHPRTPKPWKVTIRYRTDSDVCESPSYHYLPNAYLDCCCVQGLPQLLLDLL